MPHIQNVTSWRRMPVFIGSTFADLHHERDLITRLVLSQVNKRLQRGGRGVEVVPVDLRWGIETSHLDPAARERALLEVCTGEVRRCRPLFLGLLGSTYGKVPDVDTTNRVLAAAGIEPPGFPLSITAVEVLVALEAWRTDGVAPILLGREGIDTRSDEMADRHLAFLKHYVTHTVGRAIPLFASDRELVEMATEALVTTVEQVTRPSPERTWLAAELDRHRWAVHQLVEDAGNQPPACELVVRQWDLQHQLTRQIGNDIRQPLWSERAPRGHGIVGLVGPTGSGKSTVAAFLRDVPLPGTPQRAFVRVGETPSSAQLPVCLLLLIAQLDGEEAAAQILGDRSGDAVRLDDVLPSWLAILRRVAEPLAGPLIIVDGIDRFDGPVDEIGAWAWLPWHGGRYARILVTATEKTPWDMGLRVRQTPQVMLGDLSRAAAEMTVRARLGRQHRSLPPRLLTILVNSSARPRWLAVVTELLSTLMRHDYLRAGFPGDDQESRLREMVESVAASLPASLEDLYAEAFKRMALLIGEPLRIVLGLIALTVRGLRESDLLAILHERGHTVVEANLALMRDVMAGFVETPLDRWRFVDDSARRAALKLTLPGEVPKFAADLVRQLRSLPVADPVRSREYLTLLWMTDPVAFAHAVTDPGQSNVTDLEVATVMLQSPSFGQSPAEGISAIIKVAQSWKDRLSILHVVVVNVMPTAEPATEKILAATCHVLLTGAPVDARSRLGESATSLRALMDISHIEEHSDWLRAATAGTVSLAERPRTTHFNTPATLMRSMMASMDLVARYANRVPLPRLNDYAVARSAIAEAAAKLDKISAAGAFSASLARLRIDATEWIVDSCWGMNNDENGKTIIARIAELSDRHRGRVALPFLLADCVLRRITELKGAADDHEPGVAATLEILNLIEDLTWQLEFQINLFPGGTGTLEDRVIAAGLIATTHLLRYSQLADATVAALPACRSPRLMAVMGPRGAAAMTEVFVDCWRSSRTGIDPLPVVARAINDLDRPHVGTAADASSKSLLLEILAQHGHIEEVVKSARRLQRLLLAGTLPVSPDALLNKTISSIANHWADDLRAGRDDPVTAARKTKSIAELRSLPGVRPGQ